jgi:hypothetical protein
MGSVGHHRADEDVVVLSVGALAGFIRSPQYRIDAMPVIQDKVLVGGLDFDRMYPR